MLFLNKMIGVTDLVLLKSLESMIDPLGLSGHTWSFRHLPGIQHPLRFYKGQDDCWWWPVNELPKGWNKKLQGPLGPE